MTLPDQLTLTRAISVPIVVILFAWDFTDHAYWATAVFALAMATDQVDGWLARRRNQTSAFGALLDPIADKVLVMVALVMLVAEGVAPAWMVAAIVAREIAISGLRLALAQSWLFLVAAELIASSAGLGFLLVDSQNNGRVDRILLAIILLAVLGKTSDAILGIFERWAIRRWT